MLRSCTLGIRHSSVTTRRALSSAASSGLGPTVTTILNPLSPPPTPSLPMNVPPAIAAAIADYSERPIQRLRLGSMLEWSKACGGSSLGDGGGGSGAMVVKRRSALAQSAMFLHGELPIRLAERIRCLDMLPCGLNLMPAVLTVRQWYVQSFTELLQCPMPTDEAKVEAFTGALKSVWGRHGLTAVNVAKGVKELEKRLQVSAISGVDLPNLSSALDQFHLGRIGVRLLVGHHLLLQSNKRPGFIGMLKEDVNLRTVAERAVADANQICTRTYGRAPPVVILECGNDRFLHVPDHLYFCTLEAIKNAMRAVMDFHGEIVGSTLPEIKIVIASSPEAEDAAIKISDEGGGISRANMAKIWSHVFTTSEMANDEDIPDSGNPVNMPLAGLGLGLPSARCYARYFGGDLNVVSLEGHGTDVYVHIDKSGDQVEADASPKDAVQMAVESLTN